MSHDADYKNFTADLWRMGNKLDSAKHYASGRQWIDAMDLMDGIKDDARIARNLANGAQKREWRKPGRANPRRKKSKTKYRVRRNFKKHSKRSKASRRRSRRGKR